MINKLMNVSEIRNTHIRLTLSMVWIVISSLLQTFVIQTFMNPSDLLPSGFTGLALLLSKAADLTGVPLSPSAGILLLNIPAALFCAGKISRRFVFLSCLQFGCTSLFLQVLHFQPIFDDVILNILFGGFLYGMVSVIALKTDGSTGGTDFIALYISEQFHTSIWDYVFMFNAGMIAIFGLLFGWTPAGFSILFQLISTRTISSFYHRYAQVIVEAATSKPQEVSTAFQTHFHHGMSITQAKGAYSQKTYYLCKSVISTYEERSVVETLRHADPNAIIYTSRVDHFYGSFYFRPIE